MVFIIPNFSYNYSINFLKNICKTVKLKLNITDLFFFFFFLSSVFVSTDPENLGCVLLFSNQLSTQLSYTLYRKLPILKGCFSYLVVVWLFLVHILFWSYNDMLLVKLFVCFKDLNHLFVFLLSLATKVWISWTLLHWLQSEATKQAGER